tara:strand:+ start:5520 stop:5744 length:225 start_codon:yes stop_codon:yes gene_type:complete
MEIELTHRGFDFDVEVEITEPQEQTLEQAGILFSLDATSIKFRFHDEELLEWLSDKAIEEIEALALETLVDDTF